MKIETKCAVILCNGEPPGREQLISGLESADLFIAADGGGNTARQFGLTPDLVIGDLDSYYSRPDDTIPVLSRPDQNSNDLEKAFAYVAEKGVNSVIVFGATGRRVDQTVKNLSVLKQFHPQFQSLIFRDSYCDIQLLEAHYQAELPLHTSVSLFPLSGVVEGITTRGLKYSLNNGRLENGVFDGSSNETVEPEISIRHSSGDLLFFINHKTD